MARLCELSAGVAATPVLSSSSLTLLVVLWVVVLVVGLGVPVLSHC